MKVEEEKMIMEEGGKETVEKKMEDCDPSTANFTNLVNGSEAGEEGENGFLPQPTTATTTPRPVGTDFSASPTQMTIFYGGRVCVFDGVAAEKAQEIMLMAAAAASAVSPHTTATKVDGDGGGGGVFSRCSSIQSTTASVTAAPPHTTNTSSITASCDVPSAVVAPSPVFTRCLTMQSTTGAGASDGAAASLPIFRRCLSLHSATAAGAGAVHLPTTNTMANGDVHSAAVGSSTPEFTRCSSMQSTAGVAPVGASPLAQIPIARRQSLFRFLEKRRDRLVTKSPYPPPPASKTTTTDEANDNKVVDISSTGDASSQLGCHSQTTGKKSQEVQPPPASPTVA